MYNLSKYFCSIILILYFIEILIRFSFHDFKYIHISNYNEFLNHLLSDIKLITSIILFLLILLILIEIIIRLRNDNFINLIKSIKQTFFLRLFLHRHDNNDSSPIIENSVTLSKKTTNKKFNKIIPYCFVNVWNDTVFVIIKIPRSQQVQEILRGMEAHIREEIASNNPDYYFSKALRERNKLVFIGKRR